MILKLLHLYPSKAKFMIRDCKMVAEKNKINFKFNSYFPIKSLNLIKICALTSCQIDFTPDGTYQSYEDTSAFSQPVRSTMGVTFNELTPIFRDDYSEPKEGFSRDPSLLDLGSNITGNNAISNTDIGF